MVHATLSLLYLQVQKLHFLMPTIKLKIRIIILNIIEVKIRIIYMIDIVNHTNPQFIDMPSFALSPVAPVLFSRSEPAKSTK